MYTKTIITLIIIVFILSVFLFLQTSQVVTYNWGSNSNQFVVWEKIIDLNKAVTCDMLLDCNTAILRYVIWHTYLDRDSDWIPCEDLCTNNGYYD